MLIRFGPLVPARFVERPNRFLLRCVLERGGAAGESGSPGTAGTSTSSTPANGDAPVEVHLADPGRLKELLVPGRRVWIRSAASPTRRTAWSAVLVEAPGGQLISVDTTKPNKLIGAALEAGALEDFDGWALERREAPLGRSRIDFLLSRPDGRRLALEVKSVTLVVDGVALFPDAVTARGTRHVRELTELAGRDGWESAILFVLQRDDARRVLEAASFAPAFAEALAEASAAGVRVLGRRCRVGLDRIELGETVPVATEGVV
ncbi:MAG: DNA/RNA nuclease SfsA [Gemmatimonadota bacterium]